MTRPPESQFSVSVQDTRSVQSTNITDSLFPHNSQATAPAEELSEAYLVRHQDIILWLSWGMSEVVVWVRSWHVCSWRISAYTHKRMAHTRDRSCTCHTAELCHTSDEVDEMDRIIYLSNEKRQTGRRERPEKRQMSDVCVCKRENKI